MRRTPTLLALGALFAWQAQPAESESIPDPRQADLRAADRLGVLVERVRLEHSRLDTLEAEFVQTRQSELLLEPAEARGTFSYEAPDRVRWEYETPDPISLLISGDVMTTWYKDIDQAERIHVGRHSQRVLAYLGAGSSMAKLLEYFDVVMRTPDDTRLPYRLELTPRYARVAKRLSEMEVWIDPVSFLPIRLRYVEADGDETEYGFLNLRVNAGLPGDRFELEIPEGVDLREVDLNSP